MRAPSSMEELTAWWTTGFITGTEFFPLLLFLLSDETVDETMARVPPVLVQKVMDAARTLCAGWEKDEPMLELGGPPVADDASVAALCRWLKSRARAE